MGFWYSLLRKPKWRVFEPRVYNITPGDVVDLSGVSAAKLYKTQPHLRTVVDFLGRNVAHLGLHLYTKQSDGGRERDTKSQLGQWLSGHKANPDMTVYQLVYALVVDKALYDRAYWWPVPNDEGGWDIFRLPPSWVTEATNSMGVDSITVGISEKRTIEIPRNEVVIFSGYHPTSLTDCSPTITALKDVLAEQIQSQLYRKQLWQRGGRVSAVLQRPVDAPRWSDAQREAFREDWYAKYTGNGSRSGGTPILEDGMTINRVDFSATDQQYIEGVKLAYATVASAFHVNPTMVGILDNANYSNVREFRKMLYGDTLGPLLAEIESALNAYLPAIIPAAANSYIEFNVNEKLQADFETQAQWFQSAVGAPYMTRNEARARLNLPAVDGGDDVVTPLNVLTGGQASPIDATNDTNKGSKRVQFKAKKALVGREVWEQRYRGVFRTHARQVFKGSKAAGADLDDFRDALLDLDLDLTTEAGQRVADAVDSTYDPQRTYNYLKKRATRVAEGYHKTMVDALSDMEDWDEHEGSDDSEESDAVSPKDHLFGAAIRGMASSSVTWASSWATEEAGRQTGATYKTWQVNSNNPRAEHIMLDGETVPIGETFSNGMRFPGDSADAEDVAHCQCSTYISWE